MRRASVALAFFLSTIAANAQTNFQRGDVIAQSELGGNCIPERCVPHVDMAVFDASGAQKDFFGFPSERDQFPPSQGFLVTGGVLYAAHTNSMRAPFEGFIVVSPDARTVSAEYLKDRSLVLPGDLLQMRSGELLLAEEGAYQREFPKLIRFSRDGKVAGAHYLPPVTMELGARYNGPRFIELLADQCTVAWTLGERFEQDRLSNARRIRAFDICTNRPVADLFVLPEDAEGAAGIRQLPNGDFLVATIGDVRRFDRTGKQLAVYHVPAYHLVLTPDANGFWAGKDTSVVRVDFAAPNTVAAVAVLQPSAYRVSAMTVVGEWRAALQPVVTKRRAAR